MQGMLLVDKPAGWTSFDVVNYIRKQVAAAEGVRPKQIKVGHAGTLDPFATGLLIVLVGKDYTRRAGEYSKLDKTYELTMRLGQTSTTGDPEGEITPVNDNIPTEAAIKTALQKFTGTIMQTPPAYSAIKIDGQRAYKLARAGKEVKIEPRPVTINRLELIGFSYPDMQLIADVSSGTYIRSLVEDLGQTLGTGAYTTALRRTQVHEFNISDAYNINEPNLLQEVLR
jgi:tRNA pseudouridine55 synthase